MKRLSLILVRGCWDIGKFWAVFALVLLSALGAAAVADALRKPQLPTVLALSRNEYILFLVGQTDGERLPAVTYQGGGWDRLQRPLAILDRVCPEIAVWTRERHDAGHLIFDAEDKTYFACIYVATQTVHISPAGMADSDEGLACTLAHEFRHSRQSFLRNLQVTLAKLCGIDRSDLVEDEAYEFEGRVRRAIRGW